MPFDMMPTELKPIDKLITALLGPQRHEWYFGDCEACAIETAHLFLGTPSLSRWVVNSMGMLATDTPEFEQFVIVLGIPLEVAHRIFLPIKPDNRTWDDVEPRHVAAALEHYRDTGIALSPFEFARPR